MNKIYKVLISILLISMLATTATSIPTLTGSYTGCLSTGITKYDPKGIFYNVQPGLNPFGICKTTDYRISLYEKTYIDNKINDLTTKIDDLKNQLKNLENSPYPAIYSKGTKKTNIYNAKIWTELNSYTFKLAKDAYVYIEDSGMIYDWKQNAGTRIEIDGIQSGDSWYGDGSDSNQWTGFKNTNVRYMTSGTHIVKVYGNVYGIADNTGAYTQIDIIATDKGAIQTSEVLQIDQPEYLAPKITE